jgi:hypothetical protein
MLDMRWASNPQREFDASQGFVQRARFSQAKRKKFTGGAYFLFNRPSL